MAIDLGTQGIETGATIIPKETLGVPDMLIGPSPVNQNELINRLSIQAETLTIKAEKASSENNTAEANRWTQEADTKRRMTDHLVAIGQSYVRTIMRDKCPELDLNEPEENWSARQKAVFKWAQTNANTMPVEVINDRTIPYEAQMLHEFTTANAVAGFNELRPSQIQDIKALEQLKLVLDGYSPR